MAEGRWGEMTAIFEKLAFYWTYPFVRYALIVGVLIALCSSLLYGLPAPLILAGYMYAVCALSRLTRGAEEVSFS